LEVYSYFEANLFSIDRLGRGSAVNWRSFFKNDPMHVEIRCVKEAKVLELKLHDLEEIMYKNKKKKWVKKLDIF